MNNQITEIIINHSEMLNSVKNDQPISKIIKEIDHIVQDMYLELYGLADGRKCIVRQDSEKKGHCC
jgi:hypothetical protein